MKRFLALPTLSFKFPISILFDVTAQLGSMKDEISHLSSTKASVSSMSRSPVDLLSTVPSLNSETPFLVQRSRNSFTNESDLQSESCFECSISDESDIFGSPEKSPFTVKRGSCDLTLGEIVQELCLHLQPVLASTIKEVLTEHLSSINGTKINDSSTVSATFLSDDLHTSSFVNYGVGEEMKEMRKILDNPWNPDETFDLPRLQIETMDSWKKNFGRLNKVFEDMEPLNVEDFGDTSQNSGAVVSAISTPNPNQVSQVQHHSPEQKAISIQKKDRAAVRSRRLFQACIFSVVVVIMLVIAATMAFVMLELGFYTVHEEAIWLRLRRRPQFFLSSTFI